MRHFMWVILYESNYMSHGKRYLYIFEFNVILKFCEFCEIFEKSFIFRPQYFDSF